MFNNQTSPAGLSVSKIRKTFSKFYRRHHELISKFNVGLKTLLRGGLSEPEFYADFTNLINSKEEMIFLFSSEES